LLSIQQAWSAPGPLIDRYARVLRWSGEIKFNYNFGMRKTADIVVQEHLPIFITGPGESDILFTAVTIALVLIVIGFGALYFTIQAIPDRLVEGTSKAQMQVVGILGLISLFTMNNAFWIAALLLAAIRIPDLVTPFKSISRSLKKLTVVDRQQATEAPAVEVNQAVPVTNENPGDAETSNTESGDA